MKHKQAGSCPSCSRSPCSRGLSRGRRSGARAESGDGTSEEQAIEIGNWNDLKAALAQSSKNKRADEGFLYPTYYRLTANCVSGSPAEGGCIEVGEGRFVTLDLAGCTIDRALTTATDNGCVITVNGSLTLTDSSDGEFVGMLDEEGVVELTRVPSVRDGVVYAPGGAVLIAAEYDASDRMTSVRSVSAPARGWNGESVANIAAAAGVTLPVTYKLMLVDGTTYAPAVRVVGENAGADEVSAASTAIRR
ncbi:MAG: hypothetical protein IJU66_01715 [Oscillospiraceae bacterium]|nr:hypothetical protein [Oscillospiraceae bacterium]